MEIGNRLEEIWNKDYLLTLPSQIKERGYTYADNVKSDILITGFNPSFRENDKKGIFHFMVLVVYCFIMKNGTTISVL